MLQHCSIIPLQSGMSPYLIPQRWELSILVQQQVCVLSIPKCSTLDFVSKTSICPSPKHKVYGPFPSLGSPGAPQMQTGWSWTQLCTNSRLEAAPALHLDGAIGATATSPAWLGEGPDSGAQFGEYRGHSQSIASAAQCIQQGEAILSLSLMA